MKKGTKVTLTQDYTDHMGREFKAGQIGVVSEQQPHEKAKGVFDVKFEGYEAEAARLKEYTDKHGMVGFVSAFRSSVPASLLREID